MTDSAKQLLLREGYDPNVGARPLKLFIQRLVQDPLAVTILHDEARHATPWWQTRTRAE